MMGKLDGDILYHDMFIKPAVKRVEKKLRNVPEDELRAIVRNYESAHWYVKLYRQVCFLPNIDINLEYVFARDVLLGRFSWEEQDKERKNI